MNRARATVLSLAAAGTAVAGVFALGHSLALGAQARTTSDAEIRRQTVQLDRYQASLEASLAKRPPPLPPLLPAATTASVTQSARIVYRRTPSVVRAANDEEHSGEPREEHDDD